MARTHFEALEGWSVAGKDHEPEGATSEAPQRVTCPLTGPSPARPLIIDEYRQNANLLLPKP